MVHLQQIVFVHQDEMAMGMNGDMNAEDVAELWDLQKKNDQKQFVASLDAKVFVQKVR